MLWRNTLLLSSAIALALGCSTGYLFSSRFCKITIINRSQKQLALNQALRKLLCEHTFWIRNYLHAAFFNSPDQQAIETRLEKNQEDLVTLLAAYYGSVAQSKLSMYLKENIILITRAVALAKNNKPLTEINNQWRKNAEHIATYIAGLNPSWSSSFIKTKLTDQFLLIMQEIEAMQGNNWKKALEIFDKNLDYTLQFADELDKGILEQFPNKF